MGRAEPERGLPFERDRIDGDDPVRAGRHRSLDRVDAHPADSHDDNWVPRRTFAVVVAEPQPVVTQQPTSAALSSGMSSSILIVNVSWTVTYGQLPDPRPHLRDNAGALMPAECGERRQPKVAVGQMRVGVAYAGGCDPDLHLAGSRVTDLDLLDAPRLVNTPEKGAFGPHLIVLPVYVPTCQRANRRSLSHA